MSSFLHRHYHRHYHGVYTNPKKLFIFDLILLTFAIGLFALSAVFFFWKPGITNLIDLDISLGDARLKSGDMARITINYTNRSKHRLLHPTLALHLPPGFIIDRNATPTSVFSTTSIFTLDDLAPGATGQVGVTGQLWTEPGKEERITALLSYQTENTSDRDQKASVYLATLPESILTASLALASSTFPNVPTPFTLTLKNNSSRSITGITVLESGVAVTYTASTTLKNITLTDDEIRVISGTVSQTGNDSAKTITFITQVVPNNQPVTQSTLQQKITTIKPSLAIGVRAIGSETYLEPGQTLPLQINWRNSSAFPVKNLTLRLSMPEGLADLKATAKENNIKVDGTDLVIDSSSRTALADTNQRSEDFTLNLILNSSFNLTDKTISEFRLTPTIETESDSVNGQVYSETGDGISLPLATDLTLSATPRYFTADGDQVGRGPLPPEVGSVTKYWIFVEAINTVNPIEDTALTITLPEGVTPTGKQSVTLGAPLKWSAETRTLTWSILDIPAQSKTGWYFEVSVVPTEVMVGRSLTLLNNVSFVAKDKKVGKLFDLKTGQINNILRADDRGARNGSKVRTK